jgi:hypothetical protein
MGRIKDQLPGRDDTVGVTAADNRLFVEALLYRYRTGIPGVICRRASATGRMSIGASAGGPSQVCGGGYSSIWPKMPTTNMR